MRNPLHLMFPGIKHCRLCQKIRLLLLYFLIALGIFSLLVMLPKWFEKSSSNNNFRVTKADSLLQKDAYFVNALLLMKFSSAVTEALENSVPLTIIIELEVIEKNFWFDQRIKQSLQRFQLRYHALTNLYRIKNLLDKQEYVFDSKEAALDLLGKINQAHVIEKSELNANKHHEIRLRVYIDIWSLPEVLRPVASLASDWHLKSAWYSWVLN